jgi:hypothetical protein
MKTTTLILAFVTLFAGTMHASTEEQQIVGTVREIFTAIEPKNSHVSRSERNLMGLRFEALSSNLTSIN